MALWIRGSALLLALALLAGPATADVQPLFASHEPLTLRITGPFPRIARERSEEQTYGPATLAYDAESGEVTLPISLEVRGNFRRQHRICRFPQLRLVMDRSTTRGTLFEGQKRLKLVTNCRPGSRVYQAYIISEYVAYRVFAMLSRNSFEVRLVELTYYNAKRGRRNHRATGFLIEHKSRLAKRLDAELVEANQVTRPELDAGQAALFALFQHMIGNTDWAMLKGEGDSECCHNAKLFRQATGGLLAIPYDFDLSGLVNAEYAVPTYELPIDNVRERLYRGFCAHDEALDAAIALVLDRRVEIESMMAGLDVLPKVQRSKMLRYLRRFYDTISDPTQVQTQLKDVCRAS